MNGLFSSSHLESLSSIQRDADDIEGVDGMEAVDEFLLFHPFGRSVLYSARCR